MNNKAFVTMKSIVLLTVMYVLCSCDSSQQDPAPETSIKDQQVSSIKKHKDPVKKTSIVGLWRGVLTSPGGELPFGIDVEQKNDKLVAHIINGQERVETSGIEVNDNEIVIDFEWFDALISAQIDPNTDLMTGFWRKTTSGKDQSSQLPFTASKGYEYRFQQELQSAEASQAGGNWEAVFSDEDGDSLAVAEFQQTGNKVTGTFLTPTGDYRFLDGSINGNNLKLSAFDGAHAFLFSAQVDGAKLKDGHFWSRDSYHATWTANLSNDTAGYLPSSWEMNEVTTNDKSVAFAFENVNGQVVSLTDERFVGKPVIVNIFGTWCPNCNDEAPVLARFYDKYAEQGLEIVGLAFEFTEDAQRDKRQIMAFQKRHGINYPLLLAGINDKANATKVLGFLDEVKSYPTSIFLDRNHQVVNIHTGFSGPGTGEHYEKLVEELEQKIISLLAP